MKWHCPVIDGRHLLLGGAHISAALKFMRQTLMQEQFNDDQLPISYKFVDAIVLTSKTPLPVMQQASGWHQSCQHDTIPMTITDVMKLAAHQLELRRREGSRKNQSHLSDEDVALVLTTIGLIRGTRTSNARPPT